MVSQWFGLLDSDAKGHEFAHALWRYISCVQTGFIDIIYKDGITTLYRPTDRDDEMTGGTFFLRGNRFEGVQRGHPLCRLSIHSVVIWVQGSSSYKTGVYIRH